MDTQTATFIITSLLIKPTLMLLLVWLLSFLVRKQSAAFQHFVLALGILGVLVLPLLGAVLPGIDWHHAPVVGDLASALDEKLLALLQQFPFGISSRQSMLVIGVYCLVATWILYYQLLGWIALVIQTRNAQVVHDAELLELRDQLCELLGIQQAVDVKTSVQVSSPFMWGFWRPVILLPREAVLWDSDKKLSVLMHELGHVVRRDWLISQLVNLTCALFWFLPPLWWLANKLYDHAEIACDDLIFRLRDKHLAYAQSLLQLAGGDVHAETHSGLGMQGHSSIYWRIAAVLDKRRPRAPVATEEAQYWLITGLLLLVSMASIQVIPMKPLANAINTEWITTQLPPTPESEALADINSETFDWNSLKRLHRMPPTQRQVEEVIVRVQPTLSDVTVSTDIETESPPLQPHISVQGYLPLEVVVPEYPNSALVRGIEARVVVEFTIGSDGSIQEPTIISRSSSTKVFDKAVLAAIKKSRYQPQMFDGQPVILRGVTEEFIFKLEPSPQRRR